MHPNQQEQTLSNAPPEPRVDAPSVFRKPVRRGSPCPKCEKGILDYNGLLDLECPTCGYTEGGGAGCT